MVKQTTAKRYPERFGVYLSPADATALRALSRRSGRSVSDLVRVAIDAVLTEPDFFLRPNYDQIKSTLSGHSSRRDPEAVA